MTSNEPATVQNDRSNSTFPRRLDGKVALVIGGTGAIGTATAKLLRDAGAAVIVTYREHERIDAELKRLADTMGDDVTTLRADVADTASLIALRDVIQRDFGRLDILVNSAGYTVPVKHDDLDALTDELIDRMFQVNWRGQFATIRTFAPMLAAHHDGLVVSLSSIAAFTGVGSSIAYCAAKAGIDVMTKALARSLAPDIRLLAISPGVVDTEFVAGRGADFNAKAAAAIPIGRVAGAADIAAAIAACATMLTYSTGHIIQVDGGRAL